MSESILIVDDEPGIINSLVRMFRHENYEIFTAKCGAEGLKVLDENEVSLIISDHRMPGMTGVEFLTKAREACPDTIRIMLTGYADLEASVAAINKGEVYRFITKPWNDEELLVTVRQSLEYRNLMLANRNLTRTVKRQSRILGRLEDRYPGISKVSRADNGTIIVDEEDFDGMSLDDLLKSAGE